MKKILLILLAMIQLFSCSARNKANLTYFNYSHGSTMRAFDGEEWTVKMEDSKTAIVTIKNGPEENTYRTSSKLLDEMNQIVDRHKMYRFKGNYHSPFNVKDGWSWSLKMSFNDNTEVNGHGYMKYPRGAREAFEEITEFIKHWCSVPDSAKMWAFDYSRFNGMVRGAGESYYVHKSDGLVKIEINEGKNHERHIETDYLKIFDDLQEIVMDYKMYTFKGSYKPETEVMDGDSWRLSVYYEDDDFDISASGYMAWPEGFGEAAGAVNRYFDVWRVLAVPDGKVSKEAASAMFDDIANRRKSVMFDSYTGGYSITKYDSDGNATQTINYSAKGMVQNGVDHNDPMNEF